MSESEKKSPREKARARREFRAEAHRQSLAVASSPHEPEDQAFIDEVSSAR